MFQFAGADYRLPIANGAFTIDGGSDVDLLTSVGNTDFVLDGDRATLGSTSGGSLRLQNFSGDEVRLTGGASANRFTVTNWPGTATLDGAAGNDLLALATRGGVLNAIDELALVNGITVNAATTSAVVQGRLALGSTTPTINVADGKAAPDLRIDANVSGSVGLTKAGLGNVVLRGASSYTGTTTIAAGIFQTDVSLDSPFSLTGGTLQGNGTIGAITGNTGTLSPGASSGQLSPRGNVVLTSRNTFRAELNGTTAGQLDTGHDVLAVNGTVNLGGSLLVPTVGFSSRPGNTYRIIDNDGTDAIVGTFAGLAEGATLVASGFTFNISYRGGTGNDVVLTHVGNTAPAFPNRVITSSIDENGVATVTGQITEADVGDVFTLIVDWRDGSPIEEFEFDPSQSLDVSVQHRFLDNGESGTGSDQHVIELLWRDQHGASNKGTLVTTIKNVPPQVQARALVGQSNDSILRASGRFTDPGADSWFATVDYGDGDGPQPLALEGDGSFHLEHAFDRPGTFIVKVAVTDDDGGTGVTEFPVRVIAGADDRNSLLWWQNQRLAPDVDDDGQVVPQDALYIINRLNAEGTGDLAGRLNELDVQLPRYIDTNGDNFLAPIDVLIVINYVNTLSAAMEGEGEFNSLIDFAITDWSETTSSPPAVQNADPPSSELEVHDLFGQQPRRVTPYFEGYDAIGSRRRNVDDEACDQLFADGDSVEELCGG